MAADNIGLYKSKTKKIKLLVTKQKYWLSLKEQPT